MIDTEITSRLRMTANILSIFWIGFHNARHQTTWKQDADNLLILAGLLGSNCFKGVAAPSHAGVSDLQGKLLLPQQAIAREVEAIRKLDP